MHLGNEAITPECVMLTAGAAAAGLAASTASLRKTGIRDKAMLAAALGSLVFAAQAINVPIAPGMSAHLVGGVLLGWLLGPALGALTMAAVLLVQTVALGDGGLAALAPNIVNMALLPALLVKAANRFSPSLENSTQPLLALTLAAGLSMPLAALLIVGETALFRPAAELSGWTNFAAIMLGTHLGVGLFEGALTTGLVVALTPLKSPASRGFAWRPALVVLAAGLVLAALLVPISSASPDGYEVAARASGLESLLVPKTTLLGPGFSPRSQTRFYRESPGTVRSRLP